MSETISSGLTITIPSLGDVNWATTIRDSCFALISDHGHTGSGDGVQIGTSALVNDGVTDAKIRLRNNQYLRARNAANSADINVLGVTSSDNTELYSASGKDINLFPNGVNRYTFASNGDFVANTGSTSLSLRSNTSDGSDNGEFYIAGGGAASSNRGAFISFFGNEAASTGKIIIGCGNVVGGSIRLQTFGTQAVEIYTNNTNRWNVDGSTGNLVPATDNTYQVGTSAAQCSAVVSRSFVGNGGDMTVGTESSHGISIKTNNSTRWSFDTSGNFSQNVSNGGDLIFNRAGKDVVHTVDHNITATGTDLATAYPLTKTLNYISTVALGTGVALPSAATWGTGKMLFVTNGGANSPAVYAQSGETVNGGAVSSVTSFTIFYATSSTAWFSFYRV